MGFALRMALLSLALCFPAKGQDVDFEIGTDLICDTQTHVERFVLLLGEDAEKAVNVVNSEANDPDACMIATIAYVPSRNVASITTNNRTFHILEVLLVGILTEEGFEATVPQTVFSVVEVKEKQGA